jgi:formylglycine-generating enzyme required for sulfatase activity
VENSTPISCPSGFIPVPHNTDLGTTKDFCVMKYEAKAYHSVNQTIDADGCNEVGCTTADWGLADHIPASSSTGSPWRRINPNNASAECNSLNTGGATNYDLISNPEWMTIARNAEGVSSNFQAGVMARGWAAHITYGDTWSNTAVAPSTDSNCLYNTGANTCASPGDHLYKRTLTLSNGEEVWDLSGNVWEWVDWSHTTAGLDLGPTTCAASWVQFPDVLADTCYTGGALLSNQVFPATSNGTSVEGFGRFYGGSGGAALRGGDWRIGSNAGAFTLYLSYSTTNTNTTVGFRCVYRP